MSPSRQNPSLEIGIREDEMKELIMMWPRIRRVINIIMCVRHFKFDAST